MIEHFLLKKASAYRVDQDLHYGEDLTPATSSHPRPRQTTFVKITGSVSSGLWPCVVISPNGGSFAQESATCWAWSWENQLPRTRPLLALRDGDHTDGKPKFVAFDAGEYVRWIKITSESDSTGPFTGRLQEENSSGALVDGAEVRLELKSGNRFVKNGFYLGTWRGTTTVGSTVYPLFAANGNVKTVLTVCEGGVESCVAFLFAAPFERYAVDCETEAPLT